MQDGVTDENRRVLVWIAELMNPNLREAALLELSKKREQVPELALILWHSFGKKSNHHLFEIVHSICHSLGVSS